MLFTGRTSSGFGRIKQKLKEWVVALELEKRYSKNEIITMYLNRLIGSINCWNNFMSKVYFNTHPYNLNVNQSAMLVGISKNPLCIILKETPRER